MFLNKEEKVPFKLRFAHLIIGVVCLLIGCGFFLLLRELSKDLEAQSLGATEEVMVDSSLLLASHLEQRLEAGEHLSTAVCQRVFSSKQRRKLTYEVKIYDLVKDDLGLNFFVTDPKGAVVFDSNQGEWEGQDFSQFNEVYLTLRGEYGARSSRKSESDADSSVMYVGAPVYQKGKIAGVLAVYKEQRDIMPFVQKRHEKIVRSCLLIGLGTMILVAAVFFLVYRPIGLLTTYAQAITRGERPSFPNLGKGKEINALGGALKNMRRTLEGREYAKNYVQTLSHELKSPIASIKATAELLEEEMSEEQRQGFLQTIAHQVNRSNRVINRLLQLSRIEQLTELERRTRVDVKSLIEELAEELAQEAKQQSVEIVIDLRPQEVLGDAFLLRAVFQNLLENAIKYADPETVVSVSSKIQEEPLVVEVRNNGPALPEYAETRVFDKFYSLPQQGKSKSSGIGLALVKEALQLHQGNITYRRRSSQHVFMLTLPIEKA